MPPIFIRTRSPRRWRIILYLAGAILLLLGDIGAALIWRAQNRMDEARANRAALEGDPLSTLDSRAASRQVEMVYGGFGLLVERFTNWAGHLVHGRALARVLVVGSSAAALGCFLAAARVRQAY